MINPITIEKVIYGGYGLARMNGKVLFVPFGLPGDKLFVDIVKSRKKLSWCSIREIYEPSPYRRKAECRYFGICGGCQLLHLDYSRQLIEKKRFVEEAFHQHNSLRKLVIGDVVASPQQLGYRFRTTFHVKTTQTDLLFGYFQRKSHSVVPIDSCPLLHPTLNDAINTLRNELAYPENQRYLTSTVGKSKLSEKLVVDFRFGNLPEESNGVCYRWSKEGSISEVRKASVDLFWNLRNLNYIYSNDIFIQNNFFTFELILGDIDNFLKHHSFSYGADLYAGAGIYGLLMRNCGIKVKGVDINPLSIAVAKSNGLKFDKQSWDYYAAPVEKIRQLFGEKQKFDIVMINPPRTGLTIKVLHTLKRLKTPFIVYVSCDPATLARDCAILVKNGYNIDEIHLYDMFPQTFHVETVVTLKYDDD